MVGKGLSTIRVFEDGGIIFHCFWDDCIKKTFGDVIAACREKTGITCPVRFWPEPDLERLCKPGWEYEEVL